VKRLSYLAGFVNTAVIGRGVKPYPDGKPIAVYEAPGGSIALIIPTPMDKLPSFIEISDRGVARGKLGQT
jgi:hypothetical protein